MARQLSACERIELPTVVPAADDCAAAGTTAVPPPAAADADADDSDMVVIEEDVEPFQTPGRPVVAAVRPGDYRSLFARLRRGDSTPQPSGR